MRKIIQIATPPAGIKGTTVVVALCDDGAVFCFADAEWQQLPSIPQRPGVEALARGYPQFDPRSGATAGRSWMEE